MRSKYALPQASMSLYTTPPVASAMPATEKQAMAPHRQAETSWGEKAKDSHNMPTSQPQHSFTQPRLSRADSWHLMWNTHIYETNL